MRPVEHIFVTMIAVGKEAEEEDFHADDGEFGDWQMPLAFMKKRHLEAIEGSKTLTQTWRMKERVIPKIWNDT